MTLQTRPRHRNGNLSEHPIGLGQPWQPLHPMAMVSVRRRRGWQGIRQAAGAGLRRDACPSSLLCAVHASATRFFSVSSWSCSVMTPHCSDSKLTISCNIVHGNCCIWHAVRVGRSSAGLSNQEPHHSSDSIPYTLRRQEPTRRPAQRSAQARGS